MQGQAGQVFAFTGRATPVTVFGQLIAAALDPRITTGERLTFTASAGDALPRNGRMQTWRADALPRFVLRYAAALIGV